MTGEWLNINSIPICITDSLSVTEFTGFCVSVILMCSYVVGRLDERNDDSKLRTLPQGYYPAQLLSLTATGEVPFPTAKTIINSILKPYTHNFLPDDYAK